MSSSYRSRSNKYGIKSGSSHALKPLHRDKPLALTHSDQELLKRLLITISKGERSIERQRQVLATLNRFEPHSAFQRIDRDQDGRITSLEILKFLRDNGVEEATEADTYYVVKYFDSDGDEKLDYEDLMQMVMPCDDQYLRAAIAQRDIFEVSKHDYLDSEVESELTRLFEKEIALNRVTEELKQEMESTKSFCVQKAFEAIDDWKYGYIDRKNLKSFLRKHNYVASTAECMAIIRRLDLDADARVSREEFEEGLRPGEPYSRTMKRSQMKRGSSSRGNRRSSRKGTSVRNGELLQRRDSERSAIRTHAMDRQHSGSRRGLTKGTTPLKTRYIQNADFSMFSCSNSVHSSGIQRRSKRKKHRQPKQELLKLKLQQSVPAASYPVGPIRSSRSHRSERSARSSRRHRQHDNHSSMLKRNPSMVSTKRSKKAPKQKKQLKQSRSRKSLKRQGSMDDMHIDRLSQPVDHSKLRRKIERERKREFERSKSQFLRRSYSRSARKSNTGGDDFLDSSIMKKGGKNSSRRFGDTVATAIQNHDQWRGAFDFTRITNNTQQDETFDDSRSITRDKKKRHKRDRSARKKHSKQQNQNDEEQDTVADMSYDQAAAQSRSQFASRKPSQEKIPYNILIENQLSSIKKQIKAEQPRQTVFSKHRSECVHAPDSILPRTEEAFFLRTLQEVILLEKDFEVQKINLALRDDFNMIDAFGILDEDGKGNLNPQELHVALRRLDIPATQEDCYLLFHRFNRDMDGLLKYSEFTSAFLPVDQHYARQLGSKRLQYCNQPADGRASSAFCYETMKSYKAVWVQILKIEQSFEEIKGRLKSRPLFDLDKAFRSCDQSFNGAITASDIKKLMQEYSLKIYAEDLQLLMYRLDKDKDQKVSFLEFKQALSPQSHYIYQQNCNDGAPTDTSMFDRSNHRPQIYSTELEEDQHQQSFV